jgi:hypothetical protein
VPLVFIEEIHERNTRTRNFFFLEHLSLGPALELVTTNNFCKLINCIGLSQARLWALKSGKQAAVSNDSVSSGDKMDTFLTRRMHYIIKVYIP